MCAAVASVVLLISILPALAAGPPPAARVDALHARAEQLMQRSAVGGALVAARAERDLAGSLSNDPRRVARAQFDVARAAEYLGDARTAEDAYRAAITGESKLLRKNDFPTIRTLASYLRAYGEFLNDQLRFNEAKTFLEGALAVAYQMKPRDQAVEIALRLDGTTTELSLGNDAEAEKLARSIIDFWAPYHLPADLRIRQAFAVLARVAEDKRDYRTARAYIKKALAVHEPGDAGSTQYASIVEVAAEIDFDDATYGGHASFLGDAEREFTQALRIYRRFRGLEIQPAVYRAQEQLAEVYGVRRENDRSIAAFETLFAEIRKSFGRRFAYMSENERLSYLGVPSDAFAQFYVVAINNQSRRDMSPEVFDAALSQKGLVLRGIERMREKIAELHDPAIDALAKKIATERSSIADTVFADASDAGETLVGRIDETNYDEQTLAGDLADRGAKLDLEAPTWSQVAAKLAPGEAAVELVDARKAYLAVVLTNVGGVPVHRLITIGSEDAIARDALAAYRSEFGFGIAPVAESFYDLVWKPLVPALAGIHRVYLSTDGVLDQLAFDGVTDDDGRRLMDDYDIRRVRTTASLLDPPRPATSNTAYLVGGPAFYTGAATGASSCAEELASARSAPVRGGPVEALPCTIAEVEGAATALRGAGLTVVTDEATNASETNLADIHGPRVVHIATHGFFASDADEAATGRGAALRGAADYENPLMRSGLILAGGGETWQGKPPLGTGDDGILTAYEAADLDLHGTELVVLSACDSGLGAQTSGEGVFGLQRAFAEAGAHLLLMSVWNVPDVETQELLNAFYRHWLNDGDAYEALRAAESSERAVVIKRYGHDVPQDWAGFMLVNE